MPKMIPVSSIMAAYAIVRSHFEIAFPALRFKSSSIKREVRTALRVGSLNELNPPYIVYTSFHSSMF